MPLPRLYLSRPATSLPGLVVDNEEVLARVRASFRGSDAEWEPMERVLRGAFEQCNTHVRYLEGEDLVSPGEFAAQAAATCLAENGVAAADVDLLIYGGVARDAFEPGTSAEVAGRIGATPLMALDVTCACAGLLEAVHAAAGYFAVHDEITTAVVCAGEISRDRITYDLQSIDEVMLGMAGLTIGNAAAALLITREPLPAGGARLVGIMQQTRGEHWELCRTPIEGHFLSDSRELFALGAYAVPEILRMIDEAGWTPDTVDHHAFHQPSEGAMARIFDAIGASPQSRIYTHRQFGNTASTSWVLALDHRLRAGEISDGDSIVIAVAAAGFTFGVATAVWEDGA
jgi:3-oxoacyl-[acyl-carrier-protein] synthase III